MKAIVHKARGTLGLLPPPLAGEGWGGGEVARIPLPAPSLSFPRKWGRGRWSREIGASLASIILILFFVATALALTFPALTGRVVDDANILDPAQHAELTQKLADLEAKSTDQVVVVTLKSLQGTSIEDYGYQLGRHWQIGQKDKNNGVLLIVAPNERKVRIEVGYGLEGTLTDLVSNFIIQNSILPRFRANDYPGGINRGVDDIIQVLTGDAEEWKQRAAKRPDQMPDWVTIVLIIFVIFIFFMVFSMMVGASSRAQSGRRRRGSPWIVIPSDSVSSWSSGSGSSGGSWGGGFSGGGGSFGGGGSSGSW
jgi:uncharacterized protein